jgi:hypothetical protein
MEAMGSATLDPTACGETENRPSDDASGVLEDRLAGDDPLGA